MIFPWCFIERLRCLSHSCFAIMHLLLQLHLFLGDIKCFHYNSNFLQLSYNNCTIPLLAHVAEYELEYFDASVVEHFCCFPHIFFINNIYKWGHI
uniref:Uncharacterized protein n=1 Tax=Arundo donax TaxID=35708 RepID=A0A0A8Y9Q8_ARUDO